MSTHPTAAERPATPQQEMMRAFARNLRDWASDLRNATPDTERGRRLVVVGRLEGLAEGLDAIATLAGADGTP